MKELYISPELNLLCLAPQEKLMSDTVEFDTLLGTYQPGAAVSENADIDIDIPLN